eukprot:969339-Rhodomonas_salina.1
MEFGVGASNCHDERLAARQRHQCATVHTETETVHTETVHTENKENFETRSVSMLAPCNDPGGSHWQGGG